MLVLRTITARRLHSLVAVASTAALGAARVAVTGVSTAHADGRPADYALTAFAYGTKVKAAAGELRSGRTAPSWIGCTRKAGKARTNEVLGVDAPNNNPLINLGAITSKSTTYKKKKKQGIAAGTRSTSTVASVVLGPQDPPIPSPVLTISGLTTTATAWATTDGKLHAATDSQVLDIDLLVRGRLVERDIEGTIPGVLTFRASPTRCPSARRPPCRPSWPR